ncbi:MAG: 50S ribosome-binding GTPase [Pirellulales bacterium]|nr:50S ribosome-binding GTPase [Pirellulales bacterium]
MRRADDTIVALATQAGTAARGIVRLSGPSCVDVLRHIWQWQAPPSSPQRPAASVGTVHLPGLHAPIPAVLYLWPTQRSYTGEPVAELHLPGALPLLDAVIDALCTAGARLAQRGEFTLRAFLAGKLDLTQAEAVLGVIDAQDSRQLETALAQLAGGLARPLARLRDELLELLAHVEASLDFAEEPLEFLPRSEVLARLRDAASQVSALRRRLRSRSLQEPSPRVVLAGPPNAGKSSLFNALVCRYGSRQGRSGPLAALVAPTAGTTRDYLTAQLDLQGIACELVDTAGLAPAAAADLSASPQQQPLEGTAALGGRKAPRYHGGCPDDGPVGGTQASSPDEQAQQVAMAMRRQATIELWCVDSTLPPLAAHQPGPAATGVKRLVVWTKADALAPAAPQRPPACHEVALAALPHRHTSAVPAPVETAPVETGAPTEGCSPPAEPHTVTAPKFGGKPNMGDAPTAVAEIRSERADLASLPPAQDVIRTSAVTGEGLPELATRLRAMVAELRPPGGEAVASTAQRAAEHLRVAQAALREACRLAVAGEGEEVLAVELRAALEALGCVAGSVYTEDLLDRIFSQFCIGK